jgi:hypothetical protein
VPRRAKKRSASGPEGPGQRVLGSGRGRPNPTMASINPIVCYPFVSIFFKTKKKKEGTERGRGRGRGIEEGKIIIRY